MSQAVVSVILPVYDIGEFLPSCMNSLFNQTYKNFEIIIVDDGSHESCRRICDSYKDHEGVFVYHKKNGGLSDARNFGFEKSRGEWIIFIDPDDWVDNDHIEYLMSLAEQFGTDMAVSQHRVLYSSGKIRDNGGIGEECLDDKTCIERMLYHDVIDTSAWGKLYKRELFDGIRYPVGLCFEDIATTYALMMKAKRIAVGYRSTYTYMYRPNSIVNGPFNPHKIDLLKTTDMMAKGVISVYPDLRNAVIRRRVYSRFSTLNQLEGVKGYDGLKKDIISFIRKYSKVVLNDPQAPTRDHLAIRLLLTDYDLYRKMWGLRNDLMWLRPDMKSMPRETSQGTKSSAERRGSGHEREGMIRLDLNGIKQVEKGLLREFDSICRNNDLYYTLCGGTMLGSIRHQGFIPWDDDIDVFMPRPDYDKLLNGEVNLDFLPDYVKIVSYKDGSSNFPFMKLVDTRTDISVEYYDDRYNVRHIWIDILPMDGNSDDPEKCAAACRISHILRHALTLKMAQTGEGKSRLKAALKPFAKAALLPIPMLTLCQMIDDVSKSFPFDEGKTVCCIMWGCGPREKIDRKQYMTPVWKEFEGDLYPVPSNYVEYLTNLYGDYMQLPPVEKRVVHGITAFMKV